MSWSAEDQMDIQEQLDDLAKNGEILSGAQEESKPIDKDRKSIIDEAVTESVRRTTLIVSDMVAFYFTLYSQVSAFMQDNPWIRKHISEFVEKITEKAGKDPSITYDILIESIGKEMAEKYKGEEK